MAVLMAVMIVFTESSSHAETNHPAASDPNLAFTSKIYSKHHKSLQVVTGLLFSPTELASQTTVMDYWQTNVRFGWMLTEPKDKKSFFRGNFEGIFELTYSYVYKGPGSYMGGITALLRYNFVQPSKRRVPYFQVGAGVVYTDAYKDVDSGIGQAIEFTPQGSLGLRIFLRNQLSLDAEAMFHHLSNAGLAERNKGINSFGGFLGVTYFFNEDDDSPSKN